MRGGELVPPGPWGAPAGAWFCLYPLLLGWHHVQDSAAAWGPALLESPAGSPSLLGRRAVSALPQRVYPDAQTSEKRLEGGGGNKEQKIKAWIWRAKSRADGRKELKIEVWQMFQGKTVKEAWKAELRGKEGVNEEERKRGEDQMGRWDNREAASTTELQNIP